MKDILKRQIEGALKHWVITSEKNYQDMHSRVDELLLLWTKVEECNFVKACESFGLNYDDFTEYNHHKNIQQIKIKYREHFENLP